MRTRALMWIACATALGACHQSLTPDKTGTGGVGTGGAGTGGVVGSGGSTGTLQASCDALVTAYQNELGAARSCDVGVMGTCSQLVSSALGPCGACPTYVNDATKLNAIQQTYDQDGCAKLSVVSCGLPLCLTPQNNFCVSVDGGSRGSCSSDPARTGTGGAGGGGPGDAGVGSCESLASAYATAAIVAKTCDVGAANQCLQAVPVSLSPCFLNCMQYVNDATELKTIQQQWLAAGCDDVAVACPAIACLKPAAGLCAANDAGGGSCSAADLAGPAAP